TLPTPFTSVLASSVLGRIPHRVHPIGACPPDGLAQGGINVDRAGCNAIGAIARRPRLAIQHDLLQLLQLLVRITPCFRKRLRQLLICITPCFRKRLRQLLVRIAPCFRKRRVCLRLRAGHAFEYVLRTKAVDAAVTVGVFLQFAARSSAPKLLHLQLQLRVSKVGRATDAHICFPFLHNGTHSNAHAYSVTGSSCSTAKRNCRLSPLTCMGTLAVTMSVCAGVSTYCAKSMDSTVAPSTMTSQGSDICSLVLENVTSNR